MIDPNFVIVGFIINLVGGASYVKDTLNGTAKPNRVSWFLWTLAPMIAFAAEIKSGVGIQALMTFSVGFVPLMVIIASFVNKRAYWKIEKLDYFCGLLSILGLIFWYITKVGNIAIIFSILADALAAIPTLIKSYKAPESESAFVFLSSTINAVITLLTIRLWNFSHYGFPVYMVVLNLVIYLLIVRIKLKKKASV